MASHETGSGRVQVAGELTRESFRRPWAAQLGAYVMTVLVMVPAVWICDWALPGFHTGPPGGPLLFAAVLALVGARPAAGPGGRGGPARLAGGAPAGVPGAGASS